MPIMTASAIQKLMTAMPASRERRENSIAKILKISGGVYISDGG